MSKKLLMLVFIVGLFSLVSVSAITASIGNSRMILRTGVGEEIERYVLVKNVNDEKVSVDIFVSGDLEDNVELRDEKFELNSGEENKAYFTIRADEAGTTETKINVRYTPIEGQGVGLSSTVILIAGGETIDNGNDFEEINNEEDFVEENSRGFSFNPVNNPTEVEEGLSSVEILSISSAALIIIFILLIVYASRVNQRKKKVRRPNE